MPQDNIIILEDVKLIFRNFAGREGMYNPAGERNFAVELPQDIAEDLVRQGWNIKVRKPSEEGEPGTPFLSVKIKMDSRRPPLIRMISEQTGRANDLDESTLEILDAADIAKADLIVRAHDWNVNGNTGRKAYLQDLYVTIIENPLALKYGTMPQIATVEGPMMELMDPLVVD